MVSNQKFREIALALPEAVELPHFENTSFRVGEKIFATMDEKKRRACLKLTVEDQDLFSHPDRSIIYPVPNKWGKQGWTFVELKNVHKEIIQVVLVAAFNAVAPKRLIVVARGQ